MSTKFSHLYIERGALPYPMTKKLRHQFPDAQHIIIDRYAQIFNRPRQNFQLQKSNPNLILAKASGRLLHESDERIESFGEGRIYYNVPIRNCVYNCEYCFLQGMHTSSNILLFVNQHDLEKYVIKFKKRTKMSELYLSVSYLTDLLAFENVIPLSRQWINFAIQNPDITLELRTKSDNYWAISDIKPSPNVLLVWSITPEPLARRYEPGTASFLNRICVVKAALAAGWRVRLCFDPVLLVDNWQEHYAESFTVIKRQLVPEQIEKISFGVFRMHTTFLKRIRALHTQSPLFAHKFHSQSGLATYSPETLLEVQKFIHDQLETWIPSEKLIFVHG